MNIIKRLWDKRAQVAMPQQISGWYIFGLICLVIIAISIFIVKGKFSDMLEYFRSLMRFGRG